VHKINISRCNSLHAPTSRRRTRVMKSRRNHVLGLSVGAAVALTTNHSRVLNLKQRHPLRDVQPSSMQRDTRNLNSRRRQAVLTKTVARTTTRTVVVVAVTVATVVAGDQVLVVRQRTVVLAAVALIVILYRHRCHTRSRSRVVTTTTIIILSHHSR
jgi:hypothetical protein